MHVKYLHSGEHIYTHMFRNMVGYTFIRSGAIRIEPQRSYIEHKAPSFLLIKVI